MASDMRERALTVDRAWTQWRYERGCTTSELTLGQAFEAAWNIRESEQQEQAATIARLEGENEMLQAQLDVASDEFLSGAFRKEIDGLKAELAEYREFVGQLSRIQFEEWYGFFMCDGRFVIRDDDGKPIASGTDPFDAWKKMREGK